MPTAAAASGTDREHDVGDRAFASMTSDARIRCAQIVAMAPTKGWAVDQQSPVTCRRQRRRETPRRDLPDLFGRVRRRSISTGTIRGSRPFEVASSPRSPLSATLTRIAPGCPVQVASRRVEAPRVGLQRRIQLSHDDGLPPAIVQAARRHCARSASSTLACNAVLGTAARRGDISRVRRVASCSRPFQPSGRPPGRHRRA